MSEQFNTSQLDNEIFTLDYKFNAKLGNVINLSRMNSNTSRYNQFLIEEDSVETSETYDPLNLIMSAFFPQHSTRQMLDFGRTTLGSTNVPFIFNSSPNNTQPRMSFQYYSTDPSGNSISISGTNMSPEQISSMYPSTTSLFNNVPNFMQSNFARLISSLISSGSFEDVRVPLSPSQFDSLTKGKYSEIKKSLTENNIRCDATCVICQEDFQDDDDVTNVKCSNNHLFHTDCIRPWLTEMSKKCPTCKEDLIDSESDSDSNSNSE